jgi:hypothetical protein
LPDAKPVGISRAAGGEWCLVENSYAIEPQSRRLPRLAANAKLLDYGLIAFRIDVPDVSQKSTPFGNQDQ